MIDRATLDTHAWDLLRAGRMEEYREMMESLATAYPDDVDVRLHYGRSLAVVANKRVESLDQVKIAVDLAPSDPRTLTQAASLMFDAGEFEVAQEYVSRANALVTLSEFVYGVDLVNLAGRLAVERGDAERARPLLEGAVQADPENLRYARDLVKFLVADGDRDAADKVIKKALLVDPDDKDLRRMADGHRGDEPDHGWIEAARLVLEGVTQHIRCPVNDDDDLVVAWQASGSPGNPDGQYRLYCPSCGSETSIVIGESD